MESEKLNSWLTVAWHLDQGKTAMGGVHSHLLSTMELIAQRKRDMDQPLTSMETELLEEPDELVM